MLRHKNGNGQKSIEAEVSSDCLIEQGSKVLRDSTLINSELRGRSVFDGSFGAECVLISSEVVDSMVTQASFVNAKYSAESGYKIQITNSDIRGIGKMVRSAADRCHFSNLNVFDATLERVHGDFHDGYIFRGNWRGSPRILHFPNQSVTLTESVPGFLCANCTEYSIEEWIKRSARYGKLYGLAPDEIDACVKFGKLLLTDPGPVEYPADTESARAAVFGRPARRLSA